MKTIHYLAAAAFAVSSAAFVGCDKDQTADTRTTETRTETTVTGDTAGAKTERALDRTGNAINNAADKTGNALNTAADKTGQAVGTAVDNTTEAVRTANAKTADTLARVTASTQPIGAAILPDADRIRVVIAETVDDALTKNHFDNMVDRLSKGDRDRLGKAANDSMEDVNIVVDQISTAWTAKYGKAFDLKANRENALNTQFAMITEGALADTARLAASKTGDGAPALNTNTNANNTGVTDNAIDANSAESRRTAAVTLPASHGLPAAVVTLNYEGLLRGYKIDVADKLDGQRLHDNLLLHLTAINNSKDKWPADANDAYRLVAHHVLLALQDTPAIATGAGAGAAR